MQNQYFSIGEALGFGWNTFKNYWRLLIGVSAVWIIYFLVDWLLIPGTSSNSFIDINTLSAGFVIISIFLNILSYAFSYLMLVGTVKIYLKLYGNESATIKDLFIHYRYILNVFLANLLYVLIVAVGLVLLIVPGVFWAIKFYFVAYFIIDQDVPILTAFKKSAHITQGVKLRLLGFAFPVLGIIIFGVLCLGVGLLVAIPVTALAIIFVFKKLQARIATEAGAI